MKKTYTLDLAGNIKNVTIEPTVMTATPEQQAFKDAYYVIGDKIITLENLIESAKTPRGRRELSMMVTDLQVVQNRLKNWGDFNLKNWD